MTTSERAAQIWSVLALAAHNRQVLTYDMVGRLIGVPRQGLGRLLEPIQSYCLQEDLPPLTVLVVSRETGLPSEGFVASPDAPKVQIRVFEYDWLSRNAPAAEDLARAAETNPSNGDAGALVRARQ